MKASLLFLRIKQRKTRQTEEEEEEEDDDSADGGLGVRSPAFLLYVPTVSEVEAAGDVIDSRP